MTPGAVIIRSRRPSDAPGFTTVVALVDGGVNGEYTIATNLVGTDAEIREILAQSASRKETLDVTRAGQD